MIALSGKARRHLRALGHHLRPIVLVGKDALTDGIVAATVIALGDHELVKVKIGENAAGDRQELADALAAASKAEVVGLVGRTLLLYRAHPKTPKIVLPTVKTDGKAPVRKPALAKSK